MVIICKTPPPFGNVYLHENFSLDIFSVFIIWSGNSEWVKAASLTEKKNAGNRFPIHTFVFSEYKVQANAVMINYC